MKRNTKRGVVCILMIVATIMPAVACVPIYKTSSTSLLTNQERKNQFQEKYYEYINIDDYTWPIPASKSKLLDSVEISIPSLKIQNVTDGFGLTIVIKNEGYTDARNIEVNIGVTGGFIIIVPTKYYEIPLLSAGESTEVSIKIVGIGLGIFTKIPEIMITVGAPNINTIRFRIIAWILGPFVVINRVFFDNESTNGYTLYSPMKSTTTYLINYDGNVVHTWESNYIPRCSVYLLQNGLLLRPGNLVPNPTFFMGGGNGGHVEILDWNGSVIWDYKHSTEQYCLHHDVEMLPNGNILMIAWEYKTAAEAIAAGRNPDLLPMEELWPDYIIEVEPTGTMSGDIVWEWHVWDHLIQDFDPTKANYGVVADHPELIDLNFGIIAGADWLHTNSIDYNEVFDQILLSVHGFSEIWVIDHSTTTEEAAGHTGGNSGKGGDLLYRWGNPQAYRVGDADDQKFYRQHDAQWIESGCLGEGNILVFNNGLGRGYSSVDEIIPPVDYNGTYTLIPGFTYGPEEQVWVYTGINPTASLYSGAQRLPDGNTLICNGPYGIFFEITIEKEIVWEYVNLFPDSINRGVFTIRRYASDYPGLKNLFN